MPAKSINLLTQKDLDLTPVGRFLRWSLTYGRYIIVCTEIVVLLAFIWRFGLDRQITDLNEEIEQKQAIIQANQEFEMAFRNLQNRTEQVGSLFENQDLSVQVLKHLERITPLGVHFSAFSMNDRKVSITATATSNSNLSLFLSNLKSSEFLTDINITSLTKKTTGISETSFQIEAAVKNRAKNPT